MAVDFAIICSLVRPGRPRYPVLVHRAATLLHASSGRRLAMTPLRFANPSPPSGWIEDFHLQAVDHARHTERSPRQKRGLNDCHEKQRGDPPGLRNADAAFVTRHRLTINNAGPRPQARQSFDDQ